MKFKIISIALLFTFSASAETELKGITELIIAKDRHNDGNGTVYLEKKNGTFNALSVEAAANIQHKEQTKSNPKQKNGFQG